MTSTDNNSSVKIEKSTTEITTIDQLAQSEVRNEKLAVKSFTLPLMVFLLFRVVICCR